MTALSIVKRRMNANADFHGFKKINTRILACKVCKRRFLQFAAPIHYDEVHKEHAGKKMNK